MLSKAQTALAKMLEPDDYAYRASIIALSQGHFWLTNVQYIALAKNLSGGIQQWVHLANGHWISEKNPGYPFFAVVFQWLRIVRVTPLFYGAIGSAALYAGARRWLGRRGGLCAVVLYCSAGAAMVFAWRATMPTFTDASLIAAGAGALLWTLLAVEASSRRRTVVGLMGFLALEGATFIRYTDVVELAVAVAAVYVFARSARLRWRNVAWWLSSVVVFGGLALVFDALVYGGATATGYSSGEITFSTSAVVPNLENMPTHLLRTMPLALVAVGAVIWIAARLVTARRDGRTVAVPSGRLRRGVAPGGLARDLGPVRGLHLDGEHGRRRHRLGRPRRALLRARTWPHGAARLVAADAHPRMVRARHRGRARHLGRLHLPADGVIQSRPRRRVPGRRPRRSRRPTARWRSGRRPRRHSRRRTAERWPRQVARWHARSQVVRRRSSRVGPGRKSQLRPAHETGRDPGPPR